MQKRLILAISLLGLIGCSQNHQPFSFTLNGTIAGLDTGRITFNLSPRLGDMVVVPVKDGKFTYTGSAPAFVRSSIQDDNELIPGQCYFIIEPGVIELALSSKSFNSDSKVLKGKLSLQFEVICKKLNHYWPHINRLVYPTIEENELREIYLDSLAQLIHDNKNEFAGLALLDLWGNLLLSHNVRENLLEVIDNKELKQHKYYKTSYSKWLSEEDSISKIGKPSYDFSLPDSTGKMVHFSDFRAGKTVLVQRGSSWCLSGTTAISDLAPIYQKYHPYGFDIVTITNESKYSRWLSWVKQNHFPGLQLVELEYNNPLEVFYEELLFQNGRYLINEDGIVIANNLDNARIDEELMKRFEPSRYKDFINNKWGMPEGVIIPERNKPISTYKDVLDCFQGQAFIIDFWGTYCQPCLAEFPFYDTLSPILKQRNIAIAYVADDGFTREELWLSYIKKFNLVGYHFRMNQDLFQDLVKNGVYYSVLPTYMIINNTGQLVERNAARPSEWRTLLEQLNKKL